MAAAAALNGDKTSEPLSSDVASGAPAAKAVKRAAGSRKPAVTLSQAESALDADEEAVALDVKATPSRPPRHRGNDQATPAAKTSSPASGAKRHTGRRSNPVPPAQTADTPQAGKRRQAAVSKQTDEQVLPASAKKKPALPGTIASSAGLDEASQQENATPRPAARRSTRTSPWHPATTSSATEESTNGLEDTQPSKRAKEKADGRNAKVTPSQQPLTLPSESQPSVCADASQPAPLSQQPLPPSQRPLQPSFSQSKGPATSLQASQPTTDTAAKVQEPQPAVKREPAAASAKESSATTVSQPPTAP